eukprot:7819606-Alexandrium_andersonii.AAC.1
MLGFGRKYACVRAPTHSGADQRGKLGSQADPPTDVSRVSAPCERGSAAHVHDVALGSKDKFTLPLAGLGFHHRIPRHARGSTRAIRACVISVSTDAAVQLAVASTT